MKFFTSPRIDRNVAVRSQSDLDFGFGYSPPSERRWTSTLPKNQEVWAYALEKTYTKLNGDRRLTTLMGIVYRRNEPETIEAFDTLLSEHLLSFQMSERCSGIAEEFSPWPVVRAMAKIESENEKSRTTIHYVKLGGRWKIEGLSGRNPIQNGGGDYYSLNSAHNSPEIYGAATSIEYLKFLSMGDNRKRDRTLNNICRTAEIFVREVLHKSDAMEVLAKLEASKPNPFALETKTAKITFERYQFSNPREPEEYVSFSLVIEKAQRQPPARSPSHAGSS